MDEVRAVLDRAGLAHLSTKFEEDGYDDVTYLRECAADDASWLQLGTDIANDELSAAQRAALRDALLGKPQPKPKPKPKPAAKPAAKARPPTPEEPWEETAEKHPELGPAKSFAVGTKKTSSDGREWEVMSVWKKTKATGQGHGHGPQGRLQFWRTTMCPPAVDDDGESSSDEGAPEETWEQTFLASLASGPRKRAAAAPASALAPSVAAAPGKRPATTPRAPPEAKATPGTSAAAKSKKRKRSLEVVAEAEGLALHLSSSTKSGYKGVSQLESGRWRARFSTRRGGKYVHIGLGTYDTAVEAAVAYAKHVQSREAGAADEEEEEELEGNEEEEDDDYQEDEEDEEEEEEDEEEEEEDEDANSWGNQL